MTRLMQFANNATSRLAATLSAVGTTVTVIPGDGAKFPTLTAGQYFMATLIKADGSKEVVKVTARASDTLTIVRAAEAVGGIQTAYSFNAADRIDLRLTAGELASELDRLDRHALTGVLNKSANYTAVEADASNLIRVDSTAAACTITLPQISTLTEDFIIAVSKVSGDNNAVYIAGSGGNTINGTTPYALISQWQGAWLVADRSTNTWTAVSSGIGSSFIFVDKFTGTGAQTAFTLTAGVYSSNQVDVTISGVTQNPGIDYTATGTTLTFTSAPPNATVILARYTQSAPQVTTGTCTIERQVATLGQTGFALANGYIPGSNTMQVFVNGLLLSLGIDYTETGTNAVAFTSGLSAGDEVQFVVYGKTVSAADSGNVGYLPAGTGAVATTVQAALRNTIFITNNGAVGSGADETSMAQAALNSGASKVIIPADMTIGVSSLSLVAGQTLQIDGTLKKLSGTSPVLTLDNGCKVMGDGEIDGNSIASAHAIYAANKTDLVVDGLYIHNVGGKGVEFVLCTKYKITENRIENTTAQAVNLDFSDSGNVANNYIDTALHGIQFWGGDASVSPGTYTYDMAITGNVVKNVTGGIWGSQGQRVVVSGNTVTLCTDVGIDFEGCLSCSAIGNTVSKCDNGGLALFYGSALCTFTGNTVLVDSTIGQKFGVWLTTHLNAFNTFTGNTIYVSASNGAAVYQDTANKFNTFSGNTFAGGPFVNRGSYSSITGNHFVDSKIQIIGSAFNKICSNTITRNAVADASTYIESPLYIVWVSSAFNAQSNTVTDNTVTGWSYPIVDDCGGDNLSLNDCSNNRVSGVMYHRGTSGWYGRMSGNSTENPNTAATVTSY